MSIFATPELRAFRARVREFLGRELDEDLVRTTRAGVQMERADVARWQAKLYRQGWAAPHWPKAFGGTGWNELQRCVFEDECALAGAPSSDSPGLHLAGPMLIAEGTAQQRARYLAPILDGTEQWCVGLCESADADTAASGTFATLCGDHWIIEGRNERVRNAHQADLMLCLARTAEQGGARDALSVFVVDLKSEGVALRPIATMDEGHGFDDVFLDRVRVPRDDLVGTQNKGWSHAQALLAAQRLDCARVARTKRDIVELERLARRVKDAEGRALIERPAVQRTLAELSADFVALESTLLAGLAEQAQRKEIEPAASVLKICGPELQQRVTRAAMAFLGEAALVLGADYGSGLLAPEGLGWAERHFGPGAAIDGGSDEAVRAELARRIFETR